MSMEIPLFTFLRLKGKLSLQILLLKLDKRINSDFYCLFLAMNYKNTDKIMFPSLVSPSLVKLETSCTVILPPMVSVL